MVETTPDVFKNLESVALLINDVLSDIKSHSLSIAILKTRIEDLSSTVTLLSQIVKDDGNGHVPLVVQASIMNNAIEGLETNVNALSAVIKDEGTKGSIATRTALIERSITEIEGHITEIKEAALKSIGDIQHLMQQPEEDKKASKLAKYQFWGALLASFAAMAMAVFGLLK